MVARSVQLGQCGMTMPSLTISYLEGYIELLGQEASGYRQLFEKYREIL